MESKETQLANLRKRQREQSCGRIQSDSKERFKKIVIRKLKTSFIGAISEFEIAFGQELWGHGLSSESLTDVQRANKDKWEQVRTNILNKGNTQIRALVAEMDLHTVEFRGYRIIFGGEKKDD